MRGLLSPSPMLTVSLWSGGMFSPAVLKWGLNPPSEKMKIGLAASAEAEQEVAGERKDEDARIVERAVDLQRLGAEARVAEDVDEAR